jgi:thiosulfate/3-mercaptopyruvate sulfurtransferase
MLPIVLTPAEAAVRVADGAVRVVDMRKPEAVAAGHVPGAVALDYAALVREDKPVGGLLPDDVTLSDVFSRLGIAPGQPVIAYDDDGNGRAGRLVWTLHAVGHDAAAIMDGGFAAWCDAGRAVEREAHPVTTSHYEVHARGAVVADRAWLLAHLGDPDVVVVDTRSAKEYRGEDVRTARGGHVPGAVNFDWLRAMDGEHHKRLWPRERLLAELAALGVTPQREVVTYCQTHHRSSHTYVVLRWLGFERVRGYPGAWSDWGNRLDTPVTVGDRP